MTEAESKLATALAFVETVFPNAVQVLSSMDIRLDDRVETAAVTPSGRMLVSPRFVSELSVRHLTFVVAHELYHVLYGIFDRFTPGRLRDRDWLVNVAHDFIVNDMLKKKFEGEAAERCVWDEWRDDMVRVKDSSFVPECGLFWENYRRSYETAVGRPQPPIASFSLESLVLELEHIRKYLPARDMLSLMKTDVPVVPEGGTPPDPKRREPSPFDRLDARSFPAAAEADGGSAEEKVPDGDGKRPSRLEDLLGNAPLPELISAELEAELFPDETALERERRRENVARAGELADAREALCNQLATKGGHASGDGDYLVEALSGNYRTPWESVLQKWIDDNAQAVRSWAKASRRAGDRTDVCLPGRQKEGHIIHIVADTSGSMGSLLPAMLGMIQSFGRSAGVSCAHIVQCDSEVVSDEIVDIDDLAKHEIKGLGGGMDPPGLLRMAENPEVESVLVITDGYIEIPPREEIPYDVLWCILCEGGDTSHFCPDYGRVTGIPLDGLLPENGGDDVFVGSPSL